MTSQKKGAQTHRSDKEFERNVEKKTREHHERTVRPDNVVGNNSLDGVTNDSSGFGRGWFGTKKNSQDKMPKNNPERPASEQPLQGRGRSKHGEK